MTITQPHPDEFARLSWRQRDRAITAARALLRAYGGSIPEDAPVTAPRISAQQRRQRDREWGERVRAGEGAA